MMEVLNKRIRSLILEIVMMIGLILISIPIWKNFEANDYAAIAASYASLSYFDYYVDENFSKTGIRQLSDLEALEAEQFDVLIQNYKMGVIDYRLVFTISKTSTIGLDKIKAIVNGKIVRLGDLPTLEDGLYYYVVFKEGTLSETIEKNKIRVYLDAEVEIDFNSSLSVEIEMLKK